MSGRLSIDFAPAEGAVLRMLGLVERRGFTVHGIEMREQGEGASLALDVRPRDAGRQIEVMTAQLKRLIEVRNVSFSPSDSGVSQ
jgi:acetolactate synthase-1/3 small subunit/acetolactate synthase II small subunit